MPYWSSCATAKSKQAYHRIYHHRACSGARTVHIFRKHKHQQNTHSWLCAYSILSTVSCSFTLALCMCASVVAVCVRVCVQFCLYPIRFGIKSRQDLLCCRIATFPTWKKCMRAQSDCFNDFKIDAHTHTHIHSCSYAIVHSCWDLFPFFSFAQILFSLSFQKKNQLKKLTNIISWFSRKKFKKIFRFQIE